MCNSFVVLFIHSLRSTHTNIRAQGNDDGPKQQLWEGAMDVKPLMNEADNAAMGMCRNELSGETISAYFFFFLARHCCIDIVSLFLSSSLSP